MAFVLFNLAAVEMCIRDSIPSDVFVDDIAQALGTGLGSKGQSALAHLGGLFNEALGEVVHAQGRQRQADVLLGCPLVQIVQQFFQLTVVRGCLLYTSYRCGAEYTYPSHQMHRRR